MKQVMKSKNLESDDNVNVNVNHKKIFVVNKY